MIMKNESLKTKNKNKNLDKEYQKESWIYANIAMQYIPYVFALLIGLLINDFDFKSVFVNGDLIITAFSLSSGSILSLFNDKKSNNNIKRLRLFIASLVICFFELIVYTGIKIENRNFLLTLALSIIANLAGIIFSVSANFYIIDQSSNENNKGE